MKFSGQQNKTIESIHLYQENCLFFCCCCFLFLINYYPSIFSHKILLHRQMILTGCVVFAEHVGAERLVEELLPQCWEQVKQQFYFFESFVVKVVFSFDVTKIC